MFQPVWIFRFHEFPFGIIPEPEVFSDKKHDEEYAVLHAGGTQWNFSDVTKIDQNLDQIELYVREKEALTNAIINFKTRMEQWLMKN